MAAWTGVMYDVPSKTPGFVIAGPTNVKIFTPTLVPQYKMTGYYVAGSAYETWTAYQYPNSTPPSGHTLVNIQYVQVQG